MGSIAAQGTKILHASGQLRLRATLEKEACGLQQRFRAVKMEKQNTNKNKNYLAFISKNKGGFVIFSILALNWLSARAGKTGGSFIGPSKSNRRQLEAAVGVWRGR